MNRPSTTAPPAEQPPLEHWEGLSALRAFAMLLGITLHASVPYLSRPMNGVDWVVFGSPTIICDIGFWWVHAWRLPLFFFLAGFFAKLAIDRHGPLGFGRRRLKRLVVPYVAAAYSIVPIVYVIFAGGWYLTGQCTFEQMLPHIALPTHLQENIFGPVHLWFLQDLIIMTTVYVFLALALSPEPVPDDSGDFETPQGWWMPLTAAVPTGLLLWSDTSPVLSHHNTFLVDPPRLLYYSIFFIGGITAFQNRTWFFMATRFPKSHVLLSAPFSILFMILIRTNLVNIDSLFGRLLLGLTAATVAWSMIYGLMGCFLHHWKFDHAAVRYVADSSYWIYLCHLPIVAFAHLLLHPVGVSSPLKFVIVSLATTAIGLATYQLMVRYTIIGRYLHGPRHRPTRAPPHNNHRPPRNSRKQIPEREPAIETT